MINKYGAKIEIQAIPESPFTFFNISRGCRKTCEARPKTYNPS